MDNIVDTLLQNDIIAKEAIWESDPIEIHEKGFEEIFYGKFTGKYGKYKHIKTNTDSNILGQSQSGSKPYFIMVTAIFPHFLDG